MNHAILELFESEAIDISKLQQVDCIEMATFLLKNPLVEAAIWADEESYVVVDKNQLRLPSTMPLKANGMTQVFEFCPVSKILFLGAIYG